MKWTDEGDDITHSGEWRAERRNGLWWLYRNLEHVGTQLSKQGAQKLAERKEGQ